jgi:hypothetical protein
MYVEFRTRNYHMRELFNKMTPLRHNSNVTLHDVSISTFVSKCQIANQLSIARTRKAYDQRVDDALASAPRTKKNYKRQGDAALFFTQSRRRIFYLFHLHRSHYNRPPLWHPQLFVQFVSLDRFTLRSADP